MIESSTIQNGVPEPSPVINRSQIARDLADTHPTLGSAQIQRLMEAQGITVSTATVAAAVKKHRERTQKSAPAAKASGSSSSKPGPKPGAKAAAKPPAASSETAPVPAGGNSSSSAKFSGALIRRIHDAVAAVLVDLPEVGSKIVLETKPAEPRKLSMSLHVELWQ